MISLYRKVIILSTVTLASNLFFTGCMTSSRQEQLQQSIDKLEAQISAKDKQINNTTQTAIASQNDLQSLRDQIQLMQGAVSELSNKMKKIEETAGSDTGASSAGVINIAPSGDISTIQKQLARFELQLNTSASAARKGKLPAKIKTPKILEDTLKAQLDNGDFEKVIDYSTVVLNAQAATAPMLAIALEYRGEAKFQLKDYRGAAIDLSRVSAEFPTHPRQARALLLAGDSYVYLKNNAVAALYYQDCVKNFGSTAEGKAAAGRISNLNAAASKP